MKYRLLLFWLLCLPALAQAQSIFRIDSLPAGGLLLDKGWKYQVGDNPAFAQPGFNDAGWASLNPTTDISELPQLDNNNGRIGWFRLRFFLDSSLTGRQLAAQIRQSGAAEVYLNGRLVHWFGVLSTKPASIEAFNPNDSPVSFPVSAGREQVLAVRYVLQPGIRYAHHFGPRNPAFALRLNTTEAATRVFDNWRLSDRFGSMYVGAFGTLGLLFLTLFLFFPVRKEAFYFALFSLCLAFTWSYFYRVHLSIRMRDLYWWNHSFLVAQAVGYLFQLLAVYTSLSQKRGWIFWSLVAFDAVTIYCASVYLWGWNLFGFGITNLVNLDSMRVAWLSARRGQRGAWILIVGGLVYLVCWAFFLLGFSGTYIAPVAINFFAISILCMPASYAVFYGYDFGMTNRALRQKLAEVETLSAEKQQILATQNETLEQQVIERTAELAHKNRELEIEAALEKIRSRALAMHNSDELNEVTAVLFQKLNDLKVVTGTVAIQFFDAETKDSDFWLSNNLPHIAKVKQPYDEQIMVEDTYIADCWAAKAKGENIINKFYTLEQKNKWFDYVFSNNSLETIPQYVRSCLS